MRLVPPPGVPAAHRGRSYSARPRQGRDTEERPGRPAHGGGDVDAAAGGWLAGRRPSQLVLGLTLVLLVASGVAWAGVAPGTGAVRDLHVWWPVLAVDVRGGRGRGAARAGQPAGADGGAGRDPAGARADLRDRRASCPRAGCSGRSSRSWSSAASPGSRPCSTPLWSPPALRGAGGVPPVLGRGDSFGTARLGGRVRRDGRAETRRRRRRHVVIAARRAVRAAGRDAARDGDSVVMSAAVTTLALTAVNDVSTHHGDAGAAAAAGRDPVHRLPDVRRRSAGATSVWSGCTASARC